MYIHICMYLYLWSEIAKKEIKKTKWMNENIVKDKIKFTMESQDKIVFLDTKIVATPIADKKLLS